MRRQLRQAVKERATDVELLVFCTRIAELVKRAEAAGFIFLGKVRVSRSLPYLLALGTCSTKYSAYTFPVELRVWNDGAIHLIIHCAYDTSSDSDQTKQIFWVRMLASGVITQVMNFDKIFTGKGGG
jgi:hypothetical protein